MHQRAKFRQNWPNGFRDTTIFQFSIWRPSAVLDFQNFKFLVIIQVGGGAMCITVQNFIKMFEELLKYSNLSFSQDGGRLPCWAGTHTQSI